MIASCAASDLTRTIRIPLLTAWEMASTEDALEPDQSSQLSFIPAQVPGTVASALRGQRVRPERAGSLDSGEYWFRCRFDAEPAGRSVLKLNHLFLCLIRILLFREMALTRTEEKTQEPR